MILKIYTNNIMGFKIICQVDDLEYIFKIIPFQYLLLCYDQLSNNLCECALINNIVLISLTHMYVYILPKNQFYTRISACGLYKKMQQ